MARPVSRMGLPVAAIVMLALATATLWPARRGFAFEDLVAPLLSADTARCRMVARMQNLPAFTIVTMFRDTKSRQEMTDMGSVMIADSATGTMLTLDEKSKQARILEAVNYDPARLSPLMSGNKSFLQAVREQLLELRDQTNVRRESLGERKMGGRTLVGYRVNTPGMTMDIWGDRETGLPHTMDFTMAAFPGIELSATDFEFDVALDDSLFSLTPPAGYMVTKDTIDASPPQEKDFIAALREFAKLNDGAYPDAINSLEGIQISAKLQAQLAVAESEDAEAEVNRVRKLFARSFLFPLIMPAASDASYAGKGKTASDGEAPIFWYKPEGATTYRVIRADLSVVEAGNAPVVEGAQQFEREAPSPVAEKN